VLKIKVTRFTILNEKLLKSLKQYKLLDIDGFDLYS